MAMRATRQDFIDCVNGDLLISRKGIITHLGDRASTAVAAAEQGQRVYLTVNGRDFSYIENRQEVKL